MKIVIGPTTSIGVNKSSKNDLNSNPNKKKHTDRRKNKQDRRKSVRDGVIVSLSFKRDRRVRKDRRRKFTV